MHGLLGKLGGSTLRVTIVYWNILHKHFTSQELKDLKQHQFRGLLRGVVQVGDNVRCSQTENDHCC